MNSTLRTKVSLFLDEERQKIRNIVYDLVIID